MGRTQQHEKRIELVILELSVHIPLRGIFDGCTWESASLKVSNIALG